MKVLHVISTLGQGGIEKWLVNLTAELRTRRGEVQFDFATMLGQGGYYSDALRSMGCGIYHCPLVWKWPFDFVRRLMALLRRGRYDVVHCHADYLSGLVLPTARLAGVKVRICHVHSTQFAFQATRPIVRHLAGRVLRRFCIWDRSVCVGCSPAAIDAFLGGLKSRVDYRISTCGIPTTEYRAAIQMDRKTLRHALKWPESGKVVLHVGGHSAQKNLNFLLRVFADTLRRRGDVICVLAGVGPLTEELKACADGLGISHAVRFLGSRDDVPQLMRAADLFVFPSLYEGLGLVLIEAQATGLPALISENIPVEAQLVKGLIHRLPLTSAPSIWAERVVELLDQPVPDPETSIRVVESSSFAIGNCAEALMQLYRGISVSPH